MKAFKWLAAAIGIGSMTFGAVAESPTQALPEHAVTVHFSFSSNDLSRLLKLEKKLGEALIEAKAGEFDGHEIAADGSGGYLHMHGPDGDHLYKVIEPLLLGARFMREVTVKIRYGPPSEDVREREIVIVP